MGLLNDTANKASLAEPPSAVALRVTRENVRGHIVICHLT